MRLGGKSFAALGSAGVNNGTAGLGAHSGTKAVASLAFYIAGLKRSLAHFLHPLRVSLSGERYGDTPVGRRQTPLYQNVTWHLEGLEPCR